MKSIFSQEVLQRILDHWRVGKIEDVTYFQNAGRAIWRHYIETNQGEFSLYSYPVDSKESAEPQLEHHLAELLGEHAKQIQRKEIVHSFDQYHTLLQLTKKHRITPKQAYKDLDLLLKATIKKVFRVYGSILQMHLDNVDVDVATVLVSYGQWRIQHHQKESWTVIVDTHTHNREQLDAAVELLAKDQPVIEKYNLAGSWFTMYLSNGMKIDFAREGKFPAIEVHIPCRRNNLHIFEENLILYSRDVRDT